MRAIDALLSGLIDYAGLFPPASESMRTAVQNYAAYLNGRDSVALGRFIVPVSRLAEFEDEARDLLPRGVGSDPWKMSVLVADVGADSEKLLQFNARHASGSAGGRATIDVVELKSSESRHIKRQRSALPQVFTPYFEIPGGANVESLVQTLASIGARAKIRTGGVTPDAFPSSRDVIEFMVACQGHRVPFKATAGLHHPVRGRYRLTYEAGSGTGLMFGFLNVFAAAATLRAGQSVDVATAVLEETDATAFYFTDDAIIWRDVRLEVDQIVDMRSQFAISFGSCSFREPVDELAALDRSQLAQHS